MTPWRVVSQWVSNNDLPATEITSNMLSPVVIRGPGLEVRLELHIGIGKYGGYKTTIGSDSP